MKYFVHFLQSMLLSCGALISTATSSSMNFTAIAEAEYQQKDHDTTTTRNFKGYYDFNYNEDKGTILLKVKELNKDFLYVHSLTTGIGSNDIGLDRGQLGDGVVVRWVKSGPKLLLVQPNLKYRAVTENAEEKKSVDQAFAISVLYGFDIVNTIKNAGEQDEVYTIDITAFLLEDAHGVKERLKSRKEGTYNLDKSRSVLWMENTRAFPDNVEFEAMLTFTGTPAGKYLKTVVPDASSVSVVQHHSFIKLPENNYEPRSFHPRSGSFYTSYYDYSSPIGEPLEKKWITRHHIEKKDSSAALSAPISPIIYYLDPGTPEPVRSALLEGARWWNDAFESAGYLDGFQVQMLPKGADPMDIRYNVIQWVHRSTRGWSYGGSIVDPRTGEILKGHVSLGSLRIRQDFMLAQGMLENPYTNDGSVPEMLEMALSRIRQLSAHEVGHTLGLAHNFAASIEERASVMDYPHPRYDIKNGKINVDSAYARGIGEWDKLAIQYSYGQPSTNIDEQSFLDSIINLAAAKKLSFITDSDARDPAGAHVNAHLWDGGGDVIKELSHMMQVRKIAMKNFGLNNLPDHQPISVLEDVFVPVYFSHRYQIEAAVKWLGGMEYSYAMKNDKGFNYLEKDKQEEALEAIIETMELNQLTIPAHVLSLFPPRSYGYPRSRESFKSQTGVAFDPVEAAVTTADFTLDLLFNNARLNRIAQQGIYGNNLQLNYILDGFTNSIFNAKPRDNYSSLISWRLKELYLNKLLMAHAIRGANINVKAEIWEQITTIKKQLDRSSKPQDQVLRKMIDQAIKHPETVVELQVQEIPDGSPIGSSGCIL